MRELSIHETHGVTGGDAKGAAATAGVAAAVGTAALGAVGTAALGAGWGSMAVGAAFAASPIGVVALVGLAAYAGYQLATK
jgi:hypothetical protein